MGSKKQQGMRRLCSWQWRAIIEHAANFRNICTQLTLLNTDCVLGVSSFSALTSARSFPFQVYIYILDTVQSSLQIHLAMKSALYNFNQQLVINNKQLKLWR